MENAIRFLKDDGIKIQNEREEKIMAKYCMKCGIRMDDNDMVCPECGMQQGGLCISKGDAINRWDATTGE